MSLKRFRSGSAKETEIIPEASPIFRLVHSFFLQGWNPDNSLLESYQTSSKKELHVLYAYSQGKIEFVCLSVPDEADSKEVEEFVSLVFRSEVREKFWQYFFCYILESDKFHDLCVELVVEAVKETLVLLGPPKFALRAMFTPPATPQPDIILPEGFSLGPLKLDHADYITEYWAKDNGGNYASDELRMVTKSNISERPSAGIYVEGGPETPVAWCACYTSGSIGTLHVLEDYRGKKLAKALVRHLVHKIVDCHGILPYVFTNEKNAESNGLFISEGWTRLPICHFNMFYGVDRRRS